MARTALNQLQDQIEAVRSEAFAAGYAAAMQSIREFAAKAAPGAAAPASATTGRGQRTGRGRGRPAAAAVASPPAAAPRQRRARTAAAAPAPQRARRSAPRPQRGTNARFVEEVLQSNAPRALRPAEIRSAIQRDKGVAMAFTSIRHALTQLEARRTAEQVGNTKTWRHAGAASD